MRPVPSTPRKLTLAGCLLLAACAPEEGDEATGAPDESEGALSSINGLTAFNGFNTQNGLGSHNGFGTFNGFGSFNGFQAYNGLGTYNGLADGVGLMSSTAGRSAVAYLARCALPQGRSITKRDQNNVSYNYSGQIGVAPQWEGSACDTACQERISACLLAHVNTTGQNIALWLTGDSSAIGWGTSTDYPYREGSFFGNLFQNPPRAHFCSGLDYNQATVPGRLGTSLSGAPYTNPFGWPAAMCKDFCTAAPSPNQNNGFTNCAGFTHVVSVWRNFSATTDYKICNKMSGKCIDVYNFSTANGGLMVQWPYWGGNNQRWRITQTAPGRYKIVSVHSGKALDLQSGTGDGSRVVQQSYAGTATQQFKIAPVPADAGFYYLTPSSNNAATFSLHPSGLFNDGTAVQILNGGSADFQKWTITPAN
jgi:hypothetical protein